MKKLHLGLVAVCLLLIASILINLTGCSKQEQTENLMSGVYTHLVDPFDKEQIQSYHLGISDFSFRLFKKCESEGNNSLISPLSVLFALGMTANGADGQTLQQMESLFGMSIQELNQYLYTFRESATASSKYQGEGLEGVKQKISFANSIWFDKEKFFSPNKEFLQANANYYGAGVFSLPFNEEAPKVMNDWVKEKTEERITNLVNGLPEEAVMVLLNTLLFDHQWEGFYSDEDVKEEFFTKEDGAQQKADFMYSTEEHYLENDMVTGFIKDFYDYRYKFVALLPKEGYTVEQCLKNLDAISFEQMYNQSRSAEIDASIPKFETQYSVEMSDVLPQLGLVDAFDWKKANFSKMGNFEEGELYISDVLHNSSFEINEQGVVAGAATQVITTAVGVEDEPDEHKIVHLDRPFIYMIWDCYYKIPLFIGTMMDIEK